MRSYGSPSTNCAIIGTFTLCIFLQLVLTNETVTYPSPLSDKYDGVEGNGNDDNDEEDEDKEDEDEEDEDEEDEDTDDELYFGEDELASEDDAWIGGNNFLNNYYKRIFQKNRYFKEEMALELAKLAVQIEEEYCKNTNNTEIQKNFANFQTG